MTREDQRLMLVGSALTGLMAQHGEERNGVSAVHYNDDELSDAAVKAVKVADLTLAAMGDFEATWHNDAKMLNECWAFLGKLASQTIPEHLICDEACNLLVKQSKGVANVR